MNFAWERFAAQYEDIIYETYEGIAKITINRPEVRNAFRPKTVRELMDAFMVAREDSRIGVIILTGANHGRVRIKRLFVPEGTSGCGAMGGMWERIRFPGSMFWISSA